MTTFETLGLLEQTLLVLEMAAVGTLIIAAVVRIFKQPATPAGQVASPRTVAWISVAVIGVLVLLAEAIYLFTGKFSGGTAPTSFMAPKDIESWDISWLLWSSGIALFLLLVAGLTISYPRLSLQPSADQATVAAANREMTKRGLYALICAMILLGVFFLPSEVLGATLDLNVGTLKKVLSAVLGTSLFIMAILIHRHRMDPKSDKAGLWVAWIGTLFLGITEIHYLPDDPNFPYAIITLLIFSLAAGLAARSGVGLGVSGYTILLLGSLAYGGIGGLIKEAVHIRTAAGEVSPISGYTDHLREESERLEKVIARRLGDIVRYERAADRAYRGCVGQVRITQGRMPWADECGSPPEKEVPP